MVCYEYWEGWPNGIEETLRRALGQYLRCEGNYHVKIGITNDPDTRFKQHCKDMTWEKMTVIYKTTSIDNARNLEKRLINYFEITSSSNFCYHNERDGGAGKIGVGDYYVYLLSCPIRRLRKAKS